jgi:hypothetical protein
MVMKAQIVFQYVFQSNAGIWHLAVLIPGHTKLNYYFSEFLEGVRFIEKNEPSIRENWKSWIVRYEADALAMKKARMAVRREARKRSSQPDLDFDSCKCPSS